MDEPYLPGLEMLGRGINICGTLSPFQPPLLFDLGPDQIVTVNGKSYTCPERAVPDFQNQKADEYHFASESQQSFQRKLSVQVGLSGRFDGFSGQFSSYFSNSVKTNESYYYSVKAKLAQLWTVSLAASTTNYVKQELRDAIAVALKNHEFAALFDSWGTHYSAVSAVGGRLFLTTSTRKTSKTTETSVAESVQAQYLAIATATTKIDYSTVDSSFFEESVTNCETVGGNALVGQDILTRPGALADWGATIGDFPATIGFRPVDAPEGDDVYLVGLWTLVENEDDQNILYNEFVAYYERMTTPFYIAGGASGSPDTPYGDIRIGSVIVYRNDWAGLRLTILDGQTLSPIVNRAYQTYSERSDQAKMANDLAFYANKDVIVIVVSTDSGWPGGTLDGGLVQQLKNCGASEAAIGGGHNRREPYCLIGRPGKGGVDVRQPSGGPRAAIVGTLARTKDDPTHSIFPSQIG
jgi:MAC/Perforin domain/Interleukin-like EMT inducer